MIRLDLDAKSQSAVDDLANVFATFGYRLLDRETEEIGDAAAREFDENFLHERSGAGRWPQLSRFTQADRQRKGYNPMHPILVRTGSYRQSLNQPGASDHYHQAFRSSWGVEIQEGSEHRLFEWHERGTSRMPARSVTDLDSQAEDRVAGVVDAVLNRMLARLGL